MSTTTRTRRAVSGRRSPKTGSISGRSSRGRERGQEARLKWLAELLAVLLLLIFACLIFSSFVVSVRQDNACWAAGYELPVTYAGTCYCFGRDGRPDVVALASLNP